MTAMLSVHFLNENTRPKLSPMVISRGLMNTKTSNNQLG